MWSCGLMDKALVFGTKDCRLESCQDQPVCAVSCLLLPRAISRLFAPVRSHAKFTWCVWFSGHMLACLLASSRPQWRPKIQLHGAPQLYGAVLKPSCPIYLSKHECITIRARVQPTGLCFLLAATRHIYKTQPLTCGPVA